VSDAAQYVVGIDLGTSNSALAYAELDEVRRLGRPQLRELAVPQLVAPGDVQERSLLPSALYVPAGFELTPEQARLPWHPTDLGQAPDVVGEAAKRLGAKTPVRLIESSKSWLCHGGVNRSAPILPWHAPDGVPKRSPVEVATQVLLHLKAAWDHQMAAQDPTRALEHQHVVVTVPASFDEISRRLTLEAAKKAGLPDLHLIEEPLAAFYAFIARTGGTPQSTGLTGGERVLIADVGGGTTDFTLVEVKAPEDGDPTSPLGFERTAVGDHLLLGGDNMDLALAHATEAALTRGQKKLDAEGWAQLKLECRLAKEALFTHPEKDELPLVVTGRGSKLIGGTLRASLTRATLEQVVLEGYYPALPPGAEARPKRAGAQAGFTDYGLPYAQDPAITRHLAAFLMRHAREGEPFAKIDALLFNGGALKPILVRDRVCKVVGEWMRATVAEGPVPEDPRPLIYDEGDTALELAVARGAAYFGLVRAGLGVRVGGGSPREYFLAVGHGEDEAPAAGRVRAICVAPRGMQDGQVIEVPDREFNLVTNRPVEFPIYFTTSPRKDPVGSVVDVPEEELVALPPLQTVVKFGKQKAGTKVPVRIQVRRTELGTLELSCLSRMSGARFKLEFDLRAGSGAESESASPPAETAAPGVFEQPFGGAGTRAPPEQGEVEPERLDAAKARIDATFALEPPRPDPDQLMKGLEEDLALGRDALPLPVLRALAEHLVELMERRSLSAALETRWLNVVGFCLRPGFGVPMDEWRVRQLWRVHAQGVLHPTHDPAELNWWILWRRVAGGLARGHQEELASRAFPLLIPALAKRSKKKPPKPQSQEAAEIWRAAASLEQLGAKSRAQLGDALVQLLEEKKAPRGALWCLGRIGARKLLYGPREATVRPQVAEAWARRLMALKKPPKEEHPAACLVSMGRLTGDRQLDLPEAARREIAAFLEERGVPAEQLRPLHEVVQVDTKTEAQAFGEGLPVGLTLS
jgi:molecular chaperone DnaK (HSP70)